MTLENFYSGIIQTRDAEKFELCGCGWVCVDACMRACVRACVCVCSSVFMWDDIKIKDF